MEKRWIPDYPDAKAKERTYSHLLEVLEAQRDSIQQDKNSYTSKSNTVYRSDELNVPESVGSKWDFEDDIGGKDLWGYFNKNSEIDARAFSGISQSY